MSVPKATSSPSISDEQRERIMRNRILAEERRLARLKTNTSNSSTNSNTEVGTSIDITSIDKNVDDQNDDQNYSDRREKNAKRSLVIDSDDDDISNSVHPHSEIGCIQNKDDCIDNETNKIRNNTNDINFNTQNNKVAQNEATELIDITEAYEFRNNKNNHNINEVIDLVNTEVQDTNIVNGNNDVNSSDDECDLNSVSVSIAVDVHTGGGNNSDVVEEYGNKEISEISKDVSEDSKGKDLSENKNNLVEDVPNEIEMTNETINTNENTKIPKEHVSSVNEKAESKELDTTDKENIDLMDVDFCDDF